MPRLDLEKAQVGAAAQNYSGSLYYRLDVSVRAADAANGRAHQAGAGAADGALPVATVVAAAGAAGAPIPPEPAAAGAPAVNPVRDENDEDEDDYEQDDTNGEDDRRDESLNDTNGSDSDVDDNNVSDGQDDVIAGADEDPDFASEDSSTSGGYQQVAKLVGKKLFRTLHDPILQ